MQRLSELLSLSVDVSVICNSYSRYVKNIQVSCFKLYISINLKNQNSILGEYTAFGMSVARHFDIARSHTTY